MQSPLKEQPGAFISYLTSFQNPHQGQCHHMVKEGQKCEGEDWCRSLQQLHSSENPETQKLAANLLSFFKLNFAALLSATVQETNTLPKHCDVDSSLCRVCLGMQLQEDICKASLETQGKECVNEEKQSIVLLI